MLLVPNLFLLSWPCGHQWQTAELSTSLRNVCVCVAGKGVSSFPAQALNYFKRKEKGLNYFSRSRSARRRSFALPLRLCRVSRENRYYLAGRKLIEKAEVFPPKGKGTGPANNKVIWN